MRIFAAVGCSLLLGACAGTGLEAPSATAQPEASASTKDTSPVSISDRTMIADLIGFTEQIFPAISTTLQFGQIDDDPLLDYFVRQFAEKGYGIQRVSADQGSNFFTYSKSEGSNDDGDAVINFDATIGAVSVGRDYFTTGKNVVSPASPVRLSGTRMQVAVNDKATENFELSENLENTTVEYAASMNLSEQAPPVISLLTDDLVDRVVNQQTQDTTVQALNSSRFEVNNLFFADESNFSSILNDYEQVDRHVVVFGNDSMILGNTNKLLIEQLVQKRLKPSDLITLVGCSNGPTSLGIGNEGLALGRAERVTQALLSQGLARERILDEGCWAPVSAGEKFPSRGVVLEIWRKPA